MTKTETFRKRVEEEFIKASITDPIILRKMIDNNLIEFKTMLYFLICKAYERLIKENNNHVTNTLYDLSDKYCLSERQIKRIYYGHCRKFIRL